jgi:hypothetical protein
MVRMGTNDSPKADASQVHGFAKVRLGENIVWLIQIKSETPRTITGLRVDQHGEIVPGEDLAVCEPQDVIQWLVLNKAKGELVPE